MRLNALAAATVQVGPGAGGLWRKRVIEHAAHAPGGSVLLYCGSRRHCWQLATPLVEIIVIPTTAVRPWPISLRTDAHSNMASKCRQQAIQGGDK